MPFYPDATTIICHLSLSLVSEFLIDFSALRIYPQGSEFPVRFQGLTALGTFLSFTCSLLTTFYIAFFPFLHYKPISCH